MVHGYDAQFTSDWGRRGRTIIPKTLVRAAPAVIRNARKRSLWVRGAHIFNSCHVDLFKNHLDIFSYSIPDQLTGLGRAADSNGLLQKLPLYYRQTL